MRGLFRPSERGVFQTLLNNGMRQCILTSAARLAFSRSDVARSMLSALAMTMLWISGCDPVVAIAGAEFPDWLLCVIVGSLAAAACCPLLRLCGLERHLRPLALFYGSLVVMFSLVTWIIFFNRI